jgi:hypothetical protein
LSLDLSAFDSLAATQEAGIDVEIKGPDRRTPLGLTIRVAGPDSERQKSAYREIANARLASENADPVSATDIEHNILSVLAKATVSWSPNPSFDGQERECTAENAVALYRRYPFIFEQVRAKAENRASFIKGSATPSAGQ